MNRTLSLVAALAFAAAASCFLLPFFTVGLGATGTVPLRGIGLVLGTVVPAPSSVAMDSTAVPEDPPSGPETEVGDASSDDPTAEARRFLHERQQPSTAAAPAPAVAKVTAPANVRSLMAIAILALAIAGLAASLVAQRLARFLAAVCAIGALICAAFLLIGARDLPVVAIIQRATGQTATGAIHVEAAAGYWALLGCLVLATVASALGLRPAVHVAQGPATPQAAQRAPRPKTGMRTYSASKNTARPVQPSPPPGPAATSAASPAVQPMNASPPPAPANPISPTTMVPDEPGNGPGTPPPPQGGWSFANTPPAEPSQNDPPEKGSDAQGTPLSTWSFASGGQPRTPEPPPPPPSQPPPSRRTAHSGSQDTWSFGGGTPPQPPVSPPPPPQPPSSGLSSSGTGGGRPPEPPRPPVPPPPPPPPRYSAPPPPPPPSHDQDPMEPQDPYRQPSQQGANVFTGFARPYFDVIDSGALYRKPFFILYTVFAVLNLLSILGVLGFMFKGGVTLIVTGLFMIFALWIGFQLWWNRREKVNSFVTHGSEFVALPVFSHLFQTIGEWTGTFVAIAGTGASLGGLIGSIGSENRGYGHGNPMAEFGNLGVAGLIACPIAGFLILILSRAIAEQIRALVAVANNTRNIERNTAR